MILDLGAQLVKGHKIGFTCTDRCLICKMVTPNVVAVSKGMCILWLSVGFNLNDIETGSA